MDASLLTLGAVSATIVAGWSQIKNTFNYLSSFILAKATFDSTFASALRVHLKTNYKVVPTGNLMFQSYSPPNGIKGNHPGNDSVPIKTLPDTVIFYKGLRVIVVNYNNGVLKMTTLRFLVDFGQLLSDALDQWSGVYSARVNFKNSLNNRYTVINAIGCEKVGMPERNRNEVISRTSADRDSPVSESIGWPIDIDIDDSYKYDKSLFLLGPDEGYDPFAKLYYPEHILKYVSQAREWLNKGDWYMERGIPWRRGWLLHGPAGTGKSSLAKAIAQDLKLPIVRFYLSTMSDQEFIQEWENLPTPCVVLFEDFDSVFNKREPLTEHKLLTFDCVLNQISGVSSSFGVFLIITTNHIDKIDEAVGVSCGHNGISTRPGRIDTVIEVGLISEPNRRRMALNVLRDWPEDIEPLVAQGAGMSPVQFQEFLIQHAFNKMGN